MCSFTSTKRDAVIDFHPTSKGLRHKTCFGKEIHSAFRMDWATVVTDASVFLLLPLIFPTRPSQTQIVQHGTHIRVVLQ